MIYWDSQLICAR